MSIRTDEELPGVAALADRPADGRRVALVMAALAMVLATLAVLGVEHLLASANEEAEGGRLLRRYAARFEHPPRAPSHLALVLIDGMRVDEARRLASFRALAPRAVMGEIAVPTPTLSRPFYHLLFTGVPSAASGVRSNRFGARARHDAVPDCVRAAGGSVIFLAEDLDWMRRMVGRASDGGSDRASALVEGSIDAHLERWLAAPAPSLLVVHVTSGDHSAHEGGIASAEHAAALALADRVIARVAEARDAALVVLSDHGHRAPGGHGGPELEVARAPLLVRAPGLAPRVLDRPVDAVRLAATLSALAGVASPRSAVGAPIEAIAGRSIDAQEHARLASIAQQGEHVARVSLARRRQWAVPLALLVLVMLLGPIKRAYGFDRSVPVALLAFPVGLVALHLALGRPLTLSAIDTVRAHELRVAAIGVASALVAFVAARMLGRGDGPARTRRAAASVGWSALANAMGWSACVGLSLGPWPLSPFETYVPLLALGAGAPALVAMAVVLALSALRERRAVASEASRLGERPRSSAAS